MNKKAVLFILLGAMMMAAAGLLAGYNLYLSAKAGKTAEKTADILLEAFAAADENENPSRRLPDRTGIFTGETEAPSTEDAYTGSKNAPSGDETDIIPPESTVAPAETTDLPEPETETEPEPAPVRSVNGQDYAAVIVIPALDLTLPVLATFSDEGLKNSPCCYDGTLRENNLIIAGHNYISHFGRLGRLKKNDEILVYDVSGNEYRYRVTETESLSQYDRTGLISGNYGLTLFTCTADRTHRITVRCEKTD